MVKKRQETNFKILGQTKGCLGRIKSWYELDRGEVLEGEVLGLVEVTGTIFTGSMEICKA